MRVREFATERGCVKDYPLVGSLRHRSVDIAEGTLVEIAVEEHVGSAHAHGAHDVLVSVQTHCLEIGPFDFGTAHRDER